MSDGNSAFNPKIDVFMPLYIGRYLQDTAHLDAQKSGALLHLLMHIWVRGPLPNDQAALATIAKCTPDAWSMTQASVMQYLFLGSDGMLHQKGAERLKAAWLDKRLKAHEKAQKAARARWSKYKAKKERENEELAKTGDAPSIAQAIPEQCPTSVYEEQKQKQPPPTPSAARRGIERQANAPSMPAGVPGASPIAAAPSMPASKRKEKAKPPKFDHGAAAGRANGAQVHHAGIDRRAGPLRLRAGHPRKPVKAENGDFRRQGFEREVLRFWEGQNPEHPEYTFTGPDRRALEELLEHHPKMTLAEFQRLLGNRAASSINPAAAPHKWLRSVLDYSAGPLGRFGKPRQAARSH